MGLFCYLSIRTRSEKVLINLVKKFIENRIRFLEKEKVLVSSGVELLRLLEGIYELERVLAYINEISIT